MSRVNDFVITVATANGSGSQSSNNILVRTLFRMGIPVGGKNLFPSNIAGLPTWFTIRANDAGFTARKRLADIVVCMNPQTAVEDLKLVRPGGHVFMNAEIKLPEGALPKDIQFIPIPFREIVTPLSDSVKLRKLLANIIYVGVLAELLKIPQDILDGVVRHQFGDKESVIASNMKALLAGREWARANLSNVSFPYETRLNPGQNDTRVLIDGNTSAAMGLVFGGCTFVSWYPITPSSSLVEQFIDLADQYRVDKNGKKTFAVVQAEDELASIAMVVGAGWAGARAMTATSGPGLSLMGEAAGLSYYAEIPSVIWDVQRVGPSTGLPTRTMQGDLEAAYTLSHGDKKHVVLLPGTPNECFEFGQTAFDLAEELQTLVIVLSDLDIGMNLHSAHRFDYPSQPFLRGKVLDAAALDKLGGFQRYKDVEGDGIPFRTVTGTPHKDAAYFTRGTGHDESGYYSENPEVYKKNMDRLAKKFETAKKLVPKPVADEKPGVKIGLLIYGSSHESAGEARYLLQEKNIETNCMRVRALPLCAEVESFLDAHDRVYIVEQNRDGQMLNIIRGEMPQYWQKCRSILHYDGLPMDAEGIVEQIMKLEVDRGH
jgi:2-oxoglutarate ferredoxin oxidoreductase subunit alpha